MRTVWKYEVQPDSIKDAMCPLVLYVPLGAKPLCVMLQNGVVCVWFEVDPNALKEQFTLYSVGTGFGAMPEGINVRYLGSVIQGDFVWHIYY